MPPGPLPAQPPSEPRLRLRRGRDDGWRERTEARAQRVRRRELSLVYEVDWWMKRACGRVVVLHAVWNLYGVVESSGRRCRP